MDLFNQLILYKRVQVACDTPVIWKSITLLLVLSLMIILDLYVMAFLLFSAFAFSDNDRVESYFTLFKALGCIGIGLMAVMISLL